MKKGELEDITEDWILALDYLKRISSKSISAERCLKVLEVMHSQFSSRHVGLTNLDASPKIAALPIEVKPEPPLQPTNPPFDPLSLPNGSFPSMQGNVLDWDMQDLVWANLPWDWNLMDDLLIEGVTETPLGSTGGNAAGIASDAQGNDNSNGQPNETMGMPVL